MEGQTNWDERYRQTAYVYGEEPNPFLKQQLAKLIPGTILFPAEGEGRNAVYAATQGWKVYAFDQSLEGKKKALQLAAKNQVHIEYETGEFQTIRYPEEQFDAIALIYAHFPAAKKSGYHRQLVTYLRHGGWVIFEAYSKKHIEYNRINPGTGGPRDLGMLFSTDEIRSDFRDFDIIELSEQEIDMNEGIFHQGKGMVIRFVGRKR